jgi:hypothetical protein
MDTGISFASVALLSLVLIQLAPILCVMARVNTNKSDRGIGYITTASGYTEAVCEDAVL